MALALGHRRWTEAQEGAPLCSGSEEGEPQPGEWAGVTVSAPPGPDSLGPPVPGVLGGPVIDHTSLRPFVLEEFQGLRGSSFSG